MLHRPTHGWFKRSALQLAGCLLNKGYDKIDGKNGASNDYMADYNMRTKKMKDDINNLIIDHDAELAEMNNDIEIREVQL